MADESSSPSNSPEMRRKHDTHPFLSPDGYEDPHLHRNVSKSQTVRQIINSLFNIKSPKTRKIKKT